MYLHIAGAVEGGTGGERNQILLCPSLWRFRSGPPGARELRKGGLKLRIHDQPFQILGALLDRPGEIIRREELRSKLWPTETFVDFDHSINTAVNKLRELLGD